MSGLFSWQDHEDQIYKFLIYFCRALIGIILLFRGVEGAWIYFVFGLTVSIFQLLIDISQRMKILDSSYKIVNKTQDTVISIVFIVTNVLLINGLSDKIYS